MVWMADFAPPEPIDASTDDALRAARALVSAYRLSAESNDVDVILNGVLDAVAELVSYDAAGVYVLGRSSSQVRHWR